MKRQIVLLIIFMFVTASVFAADFCPTILRLTADPIIQYDFDGSELEIPVNVNGTTAGIIFCVFTRNKADAIGNTVNGYLGWHHVNKVDTCIYYSPLKSVNAGANTVVWDGRDQDGTVVPAGEYTYYLWAFDNQGIKQKMCDYLNTGWLWANNSEIREIDENGMPLANPIFYEAERRWIIGNDPLDESFMETCSIPMFDGWKQYNKTAIDPHDFSYFYIQTGNTDEQLSGIQKYKWVPNGEAELQTDYGEDGFSELYHAPGGGNSGVVAGGDYMYTADSNYISSNEPDADFYIYDYDGYMIEEIDLTPWWSDPDDLDAGAQMNGGPNGLYHRNGKVFLHCHCSCIEQMVDPLRYLDSGEWDDFFLWTNSNGDYVLDHNFEETAALPWVCNDYNVGPYKYGISADENLFSISNAYDVGAVSFGLLAPDGTGLGYFAYAGETAGWKKGSVYVDSGTPFDGIYCDNAQAVPHYSWDPQKVNSGIYFIGHDSVKGVIVGGGPPPVLDPYITVTSPNGREELERGSHVTITWRYRKIEQVKIEYSPDGGSTWTPIVESAEASSGTYSWTAPTEISDRCLIRITDMDDPAVQDTSDRTFSIVLPPFSEYFMLDVVNTGNNATLLIKASSPPELNGVPIEYGDGIGVFTPRGICAGTGMWGEENLAITVWGDDTQEEGIKGFVAGDILSFKIRDASEEKEFVVEAAYEQGDGVYAVDGIYILSSLKNRSFDYAVTLMKGWNVISLPVIFDDFAIESVLKGIEDNLVLVKNGRGEIYWPSYAVNNIGEWELTDGYQIYLEEACELSVSGYELFSPDIVYDLPENWSLISYVGPEGLSPATAFEDILDRVIVVKNGAGEVFWPEFGIEDIVTLCYGEGYWLYLSSPAVFSFPASVETPVSAEKKKTRFFINVVKTGNNATILVKAAYLFGVDGESMSSGDEIGVFTESGICAGAGVWEEGKNLAITVWGDDIMTERVDGLLQGKKYLFAICNLETWSIYNAVPEYDAGVSFYMPNSLTILESLTAGEKDVSVEKDGIPVEFSLSQNYPNPFNPVTAIPFVLPRESHVLLTIYGVTGEKVAVLTENIFPAGKHSVEWDASGFSSGIYFCRLKAGEYEETKKLMLMK